MNKVVAGLVTMASLAVVIDGPIELIAAVVGYVSVTYLIDKINGKDDKPVIHNSY